MEGSEPGDDVTAGAPERRPVVIGYDGSAVSRAAVRRAGELFAGRPAVVVTVWEPALVGIPAALPSFTAMLPDPATTEAVNVGARENASIVAGHGVELARSLGLVAEPQSVADEADVADTLLVMARERNAAVVVVGSHGISGLRTRLLGSVSRHVIEHSDKPVLVIRDDRA